MNFALALLTERDLAPGKTAREWTALQATAATADFAGVDGLTQAASDMSVQLNRAGADGTLVDFAAQNLKVQTGTVSKPSEITLDLAASGAAIGRGLNRLLYTPMFLRSMKPKALAKLAQHPGLFDRQALLDARDLYAFDNVFTAPLHGFRNTDDYWRRASALPLLHDIDLPTLLLMPLNDPFLADACYPAPAQCPLMVTLETPAAGGHVGFSNHRGDHQDLWLPTRIINFFAQSLGLPLSTRAPH